jgi:hypothetical protein
VNIFYLDHDPAAAARAHYDSHVGKMLLEATQILSTVLSGPYKPTHRNHPCVLWAAEGPQNQFWLYRLGLALYVEHAYRFGTEHKSGRVLVDMFEDRCDMSAIDYTPVTPPAQAMPEEYRNPDPVVAYRKYYAQGKAKLKRYTRRQEPEWLLEFLARKAA